MKFIKMFKQGSLVLGRKKLFSDLLHFAKFTLCHLIFAIDTECLSSVTIYFFVHKTYLNIVE